MKHSTIKFIILILFLAAAFYLARVYWGQHLDPERLRAVIDGYGVWAPVAYIILYAASACLMLPGLPVTVLGGILFGPVWGSVYVSLGATLGAALAFLIARHLGREWVEGFIKGKRLNALYRKTEEQGWKIVAFTRLVPVFPYNILNFAFGLTRIRFSHYALASFIFMFPGVVAYVVFSSSILDLMKGKVSPEFLIGAILLVLISLIPFIYARVKGKKPLQ